MKLAAEKIGVMGLGRMGRCLFQGLLDAGLDRKQLAFTTAHEASREAAAQELGIEGLESNKELAKRCDILVLAVKPQNSAKVLQELGSVGWKGKILVSIVASLSLRSMKKLLGEEIAVVRAMPNTPVLVREGITALCAGKEVSEPDWKKAFSLFQPLGRCVRVDENQMDAVTGLSGCGPAYAYLILEALADAGIKVGLARELALQLAGQTFLGAAKMLLETGRHPAALRDEVTTPAGCTIDGLLALEEGKIRVTLAKAVLQATERAKQLAAE